MNKSEIRNFHKQQRRQLTKELVRQKSQIIANNFVNNLLPKINNFSEKKLAFYSPINNEVDPIFIIKHCPDNIISLPKIISNQKHFHFKRYQNTDQLIKNSSYGQVPEPTASNKDIIPDIVFVPLVAFDKNCHRIGMGGGFYDATINYFRDKSIKQIFIGLAFDQQFCKKITSDEWDQALDFIVSETNIFSANH